MEVSINGHVEGEHYHENHHANDHHSDSGHEHDLHHEHHHEHGLHDIEKIVSGLALPDDILQDVISVYDIIAKAESVVHDTPVELIHFHEVGAMDAIADIAGVSLLIRMICPDNIIATPLCTGFGKVKCAHGILPVPAPATAHILTGIPCYAGEIEGEMCTPTGAALVKYFVNDFSRMPEMRVQKTGYGMGKRDFEAANCIRAIIGETGGAGDDVIELSCNVDDMTPEAIGFATAKLLEEGAADVYTIPVGMKKSRPGIMITVMCKSSEAGKFVPLIFKYTSTIGIRQSTFKRYTLDRREEMADTPYGKVRIKVSEGYGVTKSKAEYDDISRIAGRMECSPDDVRRLI